MRGNHIANHQYLASDGVAPYFSSPSDVSPVRQWTSPAVQEINFDDYGTSRRVLGPLPFSPTMEGMSVDVGSTSSHSESSDYESTTNKTVHSSHRNLSSRRCFMSKPIHPIEREVTAADATPHTDKQRLSSASVSASGSFDFADVSDSFEHPDFMSRNANPSEGFKCGLCERFLSQRSPWSSRRIVKSGDMPVSGVLPCRHVFHAECLDQITPKTRKNDPPCPLCVRTEDESSPEQRVFSKLRNGFPRLKPFCEDVPGPSKSWSCTQAGDCVEGALHRPSRSNTVLVLNRNRIKKNLSLKGNLGKEFSGKFRKSASYSSRLFSGSVDKAAAAVGSSKTAASSSTK